MVETRFHSKLKEKIVAEQTKVLTYFAQGYPKTYDEYREEVGYWRGLDAALKLCEEVEGEYT